MSELPLIEPFPIQDEFCCGLARIEDLGEVARFVLYSDRVLYEFGTAAQRVVCAKIILPFTAIRPGVEMTTGFLGRKAITMAGSHLLKLVR